MILRNYLYYTYESFWKTLFYVYVFYSIKCVFLISGGPHKIWKKPILHTTYNKPPRYLRFDSYSLINYIYNQNYFTIGTLTCEQFKCIIKVCVKLPQYDRPRFETKPVSRNASIVHLRSTLS